MSLPTATKTVILTWDEQIHCEFLWKRNSPQPEYLWKMESKFDRDKNQKIKVIV